jgi:hypothetical protein
MFNLVGHLNTHNESNLLVLILTLMYLGKIWSEENINIIDICKIYTCFVQTNWPLFSAQCELITAPSHIRHTI